MSNGERSYESGNDSKCDSNKNSNETYLNVLNNSNDDQE